MARGFLISDGLHKDIKRTIARVDGMPDGPGATKIPTRSESLATPVPEKNTITVKIHQNWPTLDHTPLAVGQGITLPMSRNLQTRLVPRIDEVKLSGARTSYIVSAENDLTDFGTGAAEFFIDASDDDVSANARCGVIRSVADSPENGYWSCVVQVRGLVRCRVLLLQDGQCVIPPPPYPQNATLRPFWRRYLMASTYGHAALLGIGARYRMSGTNTFPAVAEALVNLG